MAVEVILPHLGESIAEATLLRWLCQPGDRVQRGAVLGEVETDKATLELECPANGVLLGITAKEGDTVQVGQVLAAVGKEGEVWERAAAAEAPTHRPEPADSKPPTDRRRVSPLARKLAREKGIDIDSVQPARPGARVTSADVEQHAVSIATRADTKRAAAPAPRPAIDLPSPATVEESAIPSHRIPLSRVRQTVARRMTESAQTIPQFSVTVEAEADRLQSVHEVLRAQLAESKISITAVLVYLTARAIERHPQVNARYDGDGIVVYDTLNIAVAAATPDGLTAPVIHRADDLSIGGIARRLEAVARAAREGKLTPDDVSGATFTISNLGMFGVTQFVPLVNPPQAAILGVGAIRPNVIFDGDQGALRRVSVMGLTLSADHRVLDGEAVAQFLATLKQEIEDSALERFTA